MKKSMKLTALLTALIMILTMITGCTSKLAEAPPAETPVTETEVSKEEAKEEEFKPFDENGKLTLTGRDATGENGIVATSKYEASKVGIDIIKNGGNAIDAAVASGFALSVTEPQSSGLGGGGFMTIRIAETGETLFLDFREIAPLKATPEMWVVGEDKKVVNDEKMTGGKAIGVPGEVAGFVYALEKYGTMSLEEVMQPAIDLAENGYEVTPTLSSAIKNAADRFIKFPEAGKVYLKDGFPYEIGDTFKNPDLAKTLKKIAKEGKDAFYKGDVAEAIVKSVQEANGVLTLEDLANYKIEVREPVSGTYRGYEIISSPPPSSGGAHVVQILNMMENYDITSLELNSAEHLHLLSEIFKISFADRSKYMGDTAFVDVPLKGIASKEYAKELIKQIDLEKSKTFEAGDPWMYEHQDTTHYSIADKQGNLVSITKTINGNFGSGVLAGGTGVILNNEMGDFDLGAGKANSVAPGKKPLSSMSPTIVLKDGKPFMVVGSPGATKIITTVVQIISNVIDRDMDIQEAIDVPRIYDNTANEIGYETRIPQEVIDKLVGMGHKVAAGEEWSKMFGSVHAVKFEEDGTLRGGADPRKDGKALGY